MQLTPNFRLMKPDGTDPVNVQDLNDNMDVLDAEVVKKLDKTGDASNVVNKFTQAGSRTNLLSGEKLSVSFGKIMKWFVDLKDVAFSGRYSDLTDRPTIPAGGIADKSKIIDNLDDIAANTQTGYMAGALAVKELNQNLQDIMGGKAVIKTLLEKKVIRNTTNNTTMRFTVNVSGIEGYKNFTTNNFGVEPCGYNEESIGATNGANTTNQTAYIDYYDASTGIVTIAVLWGWINTSSWASVFNIYLYRGAII